MYEVNKACSLQDAFASPVIIYDVGITGFLRCPPVHDENPQPRASSGSSSPYANVTGTGLLTDITVRNAHTGSWEDELEGH